MASFQRLALHRSCRSPAARADLSSDKRPLHNLCALSEQKQNLESRAKNARRIRSLTFNPLPSGEGKKLAPKLRKGLSYKERLGQRHAFDQ